MQRENLHENFSEISDSSLCLAKLPKRQIGQASTALAKFLCETLASQPCYLQICVQGNGEKSAQVFMKYSSCVRGASFPSFSPGSLAYYI